MTIELQIGDNRELLPLYPDNRFDCVVTSPPYWGLRDYDTVPLIFDGDPNCEHEWNKHIQKPKGGEPGISMTLEGGKLDADANNRGHDTITSFCLKCGAWKGQLGLEPTPELFIKHLADIFDIVKTKLKDTGNCFINLGDTYSANRGPQVDGTKQTNGSQPQRDLSSDNCGVPAKSLCMIPQRFAWEMIQRGWILRNEIIWHKSNHMPESVTDRLTKSHEVIWHFVKQQKYFYDLDAIREPHTTKENRPMGIIRSRTFGYDGKYEGNKLMEDFERKKRKNDDTGFCVNGAGIRNHSGNSLNNPLGKNPGDFIKITIDSLREKELKLELIDMIGQWQKMHPEDWNSSDVFETTTQAYSKAHFATFPVALIMKPILAGCPKIVCKACGLPKEYNCNCNAEFRQGIVLDPFAGSGTVGEYCNENYRDAVLIELNEEYKPMIVDRANLKQIPLSKIFSFVK